MKPIDKLTDIDCIFDVADTDNKYTEYVWNFLMCFHPDVDEESNFDCSYSMPIFKRRYNDRLIKMPLTYEEYIKNQDIQATIKGLEYDVDKFWFALLFIYDFCQGDCFNSHQFEACPYSELLYITRIVKENETSKNKPLEELVEFKQNITFDIKINNKVVRTIKAPNTIKFIANSCEPICEELSKMCEEGRYSPMLHSKVDAEAIFESNIYLIFLFARLFNTLFRANYMPQKKVRSRNSDVSYSRTFLISRLIYLTRISDNEEFYYDPNTLKGYMSRYKVKGNKINSIYKIVL